MNYKRILVIGLGIVLANAPALVQAGFDFKSSTNGATTLVVGGGVQNSNNFNGSNGVQGGPLTPLPVNVPSVPAASLAPIMKQNSSQSMGNEVVIRRQNRGAGMRQIRGGQVQPVQEIRGNGITLILPKTMPTPEVVTQENAGQEFASLPEMTSEPVIIEERLTPEPIVPFGPVATAPEPEFAPIPPADLKEVSTWRARSGEPVKDVVERWSARKNIDLVWQTTDSVTVEKDISYVGTYANAVKTLIETGANDQLHGVLHIPDAVEQAPRVASRSARAPQNSTLIAHSNLSKKSWRVKQGQDLKTVLQEWTSQEGVELIWQAQENINVNAGFFLRGTVLDATEKLLASTQSNSGSSAGPIGRVYTNEDTGAPILVVGAL